MPMDNGIDFVSKTYKDTYSYIDPSQSDLSGRYVLVTGASRGIGLATCIAYAQAGAAGIAFGARANHDSLIDKIKSAATSANKPVPKILGLQLDVTSRDQVTAAAKKVQEEWGRLDVLINNAGYMEQFQSIHESDIDVWFTSLDVNVKGVYLVTRMFLPLLLAADNGLKTIITVSSVAAFLNTPGAAAYRISKKAVVHFTELIHTEYAEKGIVAISAHPGSPPTDLGHNLPDAMQNVILTDTVEIGAHTFVWLTKERREWLGGRYVSVNWDMQEFERRKEEIVKKDLLRVKLVVQ